MTPELERALAEVFSRQHGLITRSQAMRVGASSSFLGRQVDRGAWIPEARGVYRSAIAPAGTLQKVMLAVLSVTPEAAASHLTAAFLWDLYEGDLRPIHVSTPRPRWRSRDFMVHRSTDLVPEHRTHRFGIPVTTLPRTLVDLGANAGRYHTERILDRALRDHLVDLESVAQMVDDLARQGRRGVRLVRELVTSRVEWRDTTESELEDQFSRVLHAAGVPPPDTQVEIRDIRGLPIGRVDFAYPRERLVIELDGYRFHSDPSAFVRDRTRQNRILMAGFRVLRYTAADLRTRPDQVATEVRDSLRFPVSADPAQRDRH